MSKQDGLAYEMCYGVISTSNYKIKDDSPRNNTTNKNLNFICNLELILGLHAILSILDCANLDQFCPQRWL